MTATEHDNGERRGSARRSVLLWLVGFVVVFGGVSWVLTGVGRRSAPPTQSLQARVTPGPTPTPLNCSPNQLELVGAFNECANAVPDASSTCSVSGPVLEVVIRLIGRNPDAFFLYIEVNGSFTGPGRYDLPPWPHALGTKDEVPKLAVQQDGTSAFWRMVNGVPIQHYDTAALWQSVAGVLTVTGRDGRRVRCLPSSSCPRPITQRWGVPRSALMDRGLVPDSCRVSWQAWGNEE
jgi:hypothetical protein